MVYTGELSSIIERYWLPERTQTLKRENVTRKNNAKSFVAIRQHGSMVFDRKTRDISGERPERFG